jgi:hypothetical protein
VSPAGESAVGAGFKLVSEDARVHALIINISSLAVIISTASSERTCGRTLCMFLENVHVKYGIS